MEWIVGLLTLVLLEIVLGIDNVIFISILAGKLPPEKRAFARRLGLAVAMISRIILLFSITLIMRLNTPLFNVFEHGVTGRDLILIIGGLFLIAKATFEIHNKLEGVEHGPEGPSSKAVASLGSIVAQVVVVDIVFSLDSVITAVGMVKDITIMVTAVIISTIVMVAAATPISDFVDRHPTVKMLALAFLVLIGANLVADGFGQHINKGYTYFAMAFSVAVEMMNIKLRSGKPVQLHGPGAEEMRAADEGRA